MLNYQWTNIVVSHIRRVARTSYTVNTLQIEISSSLGLCSTSGPSGNDRSLEGARHLRAFLYFAPVFGLRWRTVMFQLSRNTLLAAYVSIRDSATSPDFAACAEDGSRCCYLASSSTSSDHEATHSPCHGNPRITMHNSWPE